MRLSEAVCVSPILKKLPCLLHEAPSDFFTRADSEPSPSQCLSPSEPSPPLAYHRSSYLGRPELTPPSVRPGWLCFPSVPPSNVESSYLL